MTDATTGRARADTCLLLGRLCLGEVDAPLLAALRQTPEFGPALIGDDEPLLATLRAEYARLFLLNAVPYESIYGDERMMLNTDVTVAVVECYRAAGYSPAGQVGAPDHVGLELQFLAHLALREAEAGERGDAAAVTTWRVRQRRFLHEHLGRWAPIWATAAARLARHPFYATLANILSEYVLAELDASFDSVS